MKVRSESEVAQSCLTLSDPIQIAKGVRHGYFRRSGSESGAKNVKKRGSMCKGYAHDHNSEEPR